MSTEAVSPEIEHMAWIALNEDIARHPTADGSVERTIELHKDFSIHFPGEEVLQLQVLTNVTGDGADQARREEQQAADRQALIDSFKDAPPVSIHGFRARLRRE